MVQKRFIAALAVAVLLVTAGCTGNLVGTSNTDSNDASQNDSPQFNVASTGEVSAEPDRAALIVGVEATTDDPATARQQVAENVSQLRDALNETGINADNVTTQRYTIREDYETRPDETGETRYQASHSLEVEVDDVDAVGTVIEAAADNGATNVDRVEFTLSEDKREELRETALANAMENARTEADALATHSNLTIDGVQSASTNTVDVQPYRAESNVAMASSDTDIESGPVSVTAQVEVTYDASD